MFFLLQLEKNFNGFNFWGENLKLFKKIADFFKIWLSLTILLFDQQIYYYKVFLFLGNNIMFNDFNLSTNKSVIANWSRGEKQKKKEKKL